MLPLACRAACTSTTLGRGSSWWVSAFPGQVGGIDGLHGEIVISILGLMVEAKTTEKSRQSLLLLKECQLKKKGLLFR